MTTTNAGASSVVRSGMPDDVEFVQEWRRVIFDPYGEHVPNFNTSWYSEKHVAESLLNDEYPEPTGVGFRYLLQTRWVSEVRTDQPDGERFRGR